MTRIRGGFEFSLLETAQPQFPANAFNPVNSKVSAVVRQVPLQSLWAIRASGALMSGLYLKL
jgi:hypothetical protein